MKSQDTKKNLISRLRRIEGQVKGLQRMLEEDKYCVDILVQIAAVRAAINKVGTMIVENHMRNCLEKAAEEGRTEEMIEELTTVLSKFIK
ncbi:MAG: CsoR family transcriptional regulator, copper-sensing transcriptional repressor [Clostridia bacterium]|jgi:DNA-binding FrmR family transcriptional regulator|nr:hypothetical protein [Clostridiales bacterium]MDK2986586.1 CsoR family transcriptional regulator, copper-sensing transcriptional repressor [Clostridia bacterium]